MGLKSREMGLQWGSNGVKMSLTSHYLHGLFIKRNHALVFRIRPRLLAVPKTLPAFLPSLLLAEHLSKGKYPIRVRKNSEVGSSVQGRKEGYYVITYVIEGGPSKLRVATQQL